MAIDGNVEQVAQVSSDLIIETQSEGIAEGVNQVNSNLSATSQVSSGITNTSQTNSDISANSQVDSSLEKKSQITSFLNKATSVYYEGTESEDIIVTTNNKARTITAKLKDIQYNSIGEFPNIGSENQIYVDKSTNLAYRFNLSTLTYIRLGSDWNDIEIIDGGNA